MSNFIENADYLLYIKQSRLDQLKDDLGNALYEQAESTAIAIVKDALYGRFDIDTIFAYTGTDRPAQVIRWCVVNALYFMYQRAPEAATPERVKDDYDEVLAILKDVADGNKNLNLDRLEDEEDKPITRFRWGSQPPRQHNLY